MTKEAPIIMINTMRQEAQQMARGRGFPSGATPREEGDDFAGGADGGRRRTPRNSRNRHRAKQPPNNRLGCNALILSYIISENGLIVLCAPRGPRGAPGIADPLGFRSLFNLRNNPNLLISLTMKPDD